MSENNSIIEHEEKKYYPYTSEFSNEDGEVRHTFHFRRPQRSHLVQIAKAGQAKTYDMTGEVLAQLVLPGETAKLRQTIEEWPALVPAYADEIFKHCGMGSVFAGK
ncbi:MAG: hypothetical protein AB7E46_02265 [Desulfovibrio sp.]